jgi:iron complex outermembrane receptor protein
MIKNLYYSFLFIMFFSVGAVQLNADNPVTPESEDSAPVVEQTSETVEQEASTETSAPASAASDDEVELTKISVTGSRIKRTDLEGPQPLVVITSDDIDKGGFLSVYEAVASVAQNTGTNATGGIGAFQNAANANSINLRDFGPGRTLVLINGKRRANYPYPEGEGDASFSWNRIPISIVERIEILTSGASAIYGSDAVAGVINVILVDGLEDTSVQVRYSEHAPATNRTAGESFNVEISGGAYFDNGSMVWGYEHFESNPLNGIDRPQLDDRYDEPVPAYQYGSLAGFFQNSGTGGTYYPDMMGSTNTCEDLSMDTDDLNNYRPYVPVGVYRYCNYDSTKNRTLRNGRIDDSVYLAGSYQLDNGIEITADIQYWQEEADNVYFPYFVQQSYDAVVITNDAGDLLNGVVDQSLFAPYGTAYGFLQRFFPEKNWQTDYEEDVTSISVAALGNIEVGDNIWEWEVAYTNDEYNYRDGGKEVLNDTLEAWTCGGAINGPYAAYCQDTAYGYALINVDTMWGTFEQAQSYGLWGDVYVEGVSEATSINATITGDLFMMPAGPLAFAATFEDSDTNYNIDPGPQYDAGNVWGTTRTSGGGERTRTSYALEFSVPITTSFGIQLASRYDDYDELSTAIGGKRTDQVSFKWNVGENFMVRGGWAESFAAPSLPYIYKGETQGFATLCDYYGRWLNTGETLGGSCLGYTQLNAKETSSGNLNLRAEEGENYNLGLVWNVYNTSKTAIDMTLDFVELDIRDTVSEVSSSGALIDEMICKVQESGDTVQGYSYSDAYCSSVYALITRGAVWTPQGASGAPDVIPPEGGLANVNYGYINQSGRYYRGADLASSLRYLSDNYGDFFASLSIAYVDEERRKDTAADPFVSIMNQDRRLRSKSYLSLGWNKGDWSAGVSTSRIGSMKYRGRFAPNGSSRATKIDPYFDTSAYARYSFDVGHYIQVSVSNLGDDIPDKNLDMSWPWFAYWYASPIGREVFITYRYTF